MISIIVPIYNVEKYLSKCIDSILAQTYNDIEVILVDDGSPDNCPMICDEYAQKDNRVIVIHQKNAGVSAARNAGLKAAHGEYIGFVDPDDWISSSMYQEMITALERENADLAICGYDYYDEDGNIDSKRAYQTKEDELISQKEFMSRLSDMPPTVRQGTCNKLFRAELLSDISFKKHMHSAEDVLFLSEYSSRICKVIIVHKPHYKNLVRTGSATHGGLTISQLADSFYVHDKMYNTIVKLYPDLKNHSLAFLLDVCTLKYCESKKKIESSPSFEYKQEITSLRKMKGYIKRKAITAVFNNEIYWKTRIAYLLLN